MKAQLVVQRGFTLLEVLIGFTLMAVILTMLYAGIQLAYKMKNKGERTIEITDQVRTVHTFLRRQLTGVLAIPLSDSSQQKPYYFKGSGQSLRFVSTMPGYFARGGIYEQTLELVNIANKKSLVFSFQPVNAIDSIAEKESVTLLTHIEELSFHYQQTSDRDELMPWQDQWNKTKVHPALIRLQIDFVENHQDQMTNKINNNEEFWPLFVVAPVN